MIELCLAFAADLLIGDPVYRLHPVRVMGQCISHGEDFLRRLVRNPYLAGFLLATFLPAAVFLLAAWIINLASRIHPLAGLLLNAVGIYTAVSVHDMRKEALRILDDLDQDLLLKARKDLSRIVGRDTTHLDQEDITRATVETTAESTLDGIVSPLFYAALGGAPLALTYKAINTLDSMIDHRTERYREFGFFAAQIDHWVNWFPARISYAIICAAAAISGQNASGAVKAGGQEMKSFTAVSDIPEAAFAGALDVRLGGLNVYQGRAEQKKILGVVDRTVGPECIERSVTLMIVAAWITLACCVAIRFILNQVLP